MASVGVRLNAQLGDIRATPLYSEVDYCDFLSHFIPLRIFAARLIVVPIAHQVTERFLGGYDVAGTKFMEKLRVTSNVLEHAKSLSVEGKATYTSVLESEADSFWEVKNAMFLHCICDDIRKM